LRGIPLLRNELETRAFAGYEAIHRVRKVNGRFEHTAKRPQPNLAPLANCNPRIATFEPSEQQTRLLVVGGLGEQLLQSTLRCLIAPESPFELRKEQ
jgi:hypothetical protein